MEYILLAAMLLIAGLCAVISLRQFGGKGLLLNNAWLYASDRERKAMDKTPYYRQSGVVFALLAAVFLCLGLEAWLKTGWLMWLEWALLAALLVYAVASTVAIGKRNKARSVAAMEAWDVYSRLPDGSFEKTGQTILRGEMLPKGGYHAVIHAWIRDPQGRYLISQRCPVKSHPLCWEPTGGSVLAGETSLEAACREACEELGVSLDPACGRLMCRGVRHYPGLDDFVDVWLFDGVEPTVPLHLQAEEVAQASWATPEEIRRLRREGQWMPWQQFDYLDALLDGTLLPPDR